ncbi:MAG: GNAT family N-acetyltransferase [Candidatus Binatia bacterium]
MLQIECIEEEGRFLDLKEDWNALHRRAASASFFLSHVWARCSWRELRQKHEMRIVAVRDHNHLVAVAPLMKSRLFSRGLPMGQLSFMEHPESQAGDILFDGTESSVEAVRLVLSLLRGERAPDWQLLSLDKIPPSSPSLHHLSRLAQFLGFRYEMKSVHSAPVICLAGGWEEYLKSRTPRFRKTLRNVSNRIGRLGRVEANRYTGRDQTREAVDKLFSVSDSSWKASDGIAITSSAGRRRFFADLCADPEAAQALQIWILQADGAPLASEIQIKDRDTVYALRSDFDERYADYSPGSYLQGEILKQLSSEGCSEYNMGVGRNAYKTRWANQESRLMNFRLYNQTLYGYLLHSLDSCSLRLRGFRTLQGLLPGGAR